jgi:UDP-N-acetyl-D-galactosamine dehydrogenase|tara:strand:+ start:155 stop:1420 length:1266 start_codon:yes stop_codon:yes gene_type:complete
MESKNKIAVIGLGYVGLPLALEFSKKYSVIGLDINLERVNELNDYHDKTNEINKKDLKNRLTSGLKLTSDYKEIKDCNIYIVTVPTPINSLRQPDLSCLFSASKSIGKILKKNDIVIYESTVYPGCTEEDCVPILEKNSKFKYNKDFFCGYSPERINPGDKINTVNKIVKVTSGSNKLIAKKVNDLYLSIIDAGTYLVSSIKVAEASKAIENAQRDLNISFVNELAIIFDKMNIDTTEVIDAASTKWNFLNFKPGLVGGHCICVDPYYLAHKSKSLGYHPDVILSGRKVNDNMGAYVAEKLLKSIRDIGIKVKGSKVLILGITYKENCPDTRNTKVPDIYFKLKNNGVDVSVYDPYASINEVHDKFKIRLVDRIDKYDGILLAVSHNQFKKLDIKSLKRQPKSIIFDIKSFYDKEIVDLRL